MGAHDQVSGMTRSKVPRPVVLCILDGWGVREEAENNAILQARTPVWDRLLKSCPKGTLDASGTSVGLPAGQFGNSEVGHMNIGAGRVIYQDLLRIDNACSDGSLETNPALASFLDKLKKSGGTCHILGLISPGGVHAHQDHIVALVKTIGASGVPVAIHAILDGRDTPPLSAKDFVSKLLADLRDDKNYRIATVSGRYHAMDRDKRWDRVERAYAAMADGEGKDVPDALSAITASYDVTVADEFVIPTVIGDYAGMKDGDGILMANFRADRVREILTALLDPDFAEFGRSRVVRFTAALGMVEYSTKLNRFLDTMFPHPSLENIMGWIVSRAGRKQLRIAETEKYAHVTFFFNGGGEQEFAGEDRILVPSPRVPTYDVRPEMSAFELTKRLIHAIESGDYDFIVANYANPDMVGHTGSISAAMKAVETVDTCLGRLVSAVEEAGGVMLITADHGNIEIMRDPKTGHAHTSHTSNPVPSVLVCAPADVAGMRRGCLADIAPTLLDLMGIAKPADMTGQSLIVSSAADHALAKIA